MGFPLILAALLSLASLIFLFTHRYLNIQKKKNERLIARAQQFDNELAGLFLSINSLLQGVVRHRDNFPPQEYDAYVAEFSSYAQSIDLSRKLLKDNPRHFDLDKIAVELSNINLKRQTLLDTHTERVRLRNLIQTRFFNKDLLLNRYRAAYDSLAGEIKFLNDKYKITRWGDVDFTAFPADYEGHINTLSRLIGEADFALSHLQWEEAAVKSAAIEAWIGNTENFLKNTATTANNAIKGCVNVAGYLSNEMHLRSRIDEALAYINADSSEQTLKWGVDIRDHFKALEKEKETTGDIYEMNARINTIDSLIGML